MNTLNPSGRAKPSAKISAKPILYRSPPRLEELEDAEGVVAALRVGDVEVARGVVEPPDLADVELALADGVLVARERVEVDVAGEAGPAEPVDDLARGERVHELSEFRRI